MHVLVIHIGPVQEFIESARKCRDLWFGSWLLSELARAAAGALVAFEGEAEENVLIFPGVRTADKGRSVANKIVARIGKLPAGVAAAADQGMRLRLREIRDAAFAQVGKGELNRGQFFEEEVARAQVDSAMEFLWAAAPLEPGERGYKAALDEADRLLAAVKNTKVWGQPSWSADGIRKSSLDGVRESVLDEALFNLHGSTPATSRLRRKYGVHGSERLCGVGLLKRFGTTDDPLDKPERFPSVPHIASGPFRAGLRAAKHGPGAWNRLLGELRSINARYGVDVIEELEVVPGPDEVTGRIDGSVFYEQRLLENLEEAGLDPKFEPDAFIDAKRALRDFLRDAGLGEPIPYYAILIADGDRMGKAIDAQPDFEHHRKLSATLEKFASGARKTVHQTGAGTLVYAGGDDVLALLPLHQALECATALKDSFRTCLERYQVDDCGQLRTPTLSVGMAVVHHMVPLDEALRLARAAERDAKDVPGKSALCVVVKKRGGEAVKVAGRWGDIDGRLERLIDIHREGELSSKTQYELMDLAERLRGAASDAAVLAEVRKAEARRILSRKRARGGGDLAPEMAAELEAFGAFDDPARLGRELYVASVFAAARTQAAPVEEQREEGRIPEEARS